jgi:hypothetical protein
VEARRAGARCAPLGMTNQLGPTANTRPTRGVGHGGATGVEWEQVQEQVQEQREQERGRYWAPTVRFPDHATAERVASILAMTLSNDLVVHLNG